VRRRRRSPRIALWLAIGLTPVARLGSQQSSRAVNLKTSSFIVARYATVSSASLYAGYGFGPAGIVVGAVDNPRSGYRELIGGLVSRVVWGAQALTLAVASADASDGLYLQTYLVPSLRLGSISIGGTIEWYQPLEHRAVEQLDVNPVEFAVSVTERLAIGALYTVALTEGGQSRQGGGGVLRVSIPHGTVRFEGLRALARSRSEFRFGLEAGF
jgi:hypothetical protein